MRKNKAELGESMLLTRREAIAGVGGGLALLAFPSEEAGRRTHQRDDDMVVVADVFSNGAASVADIMQAPRDRRMLDEFQNFQAQLLGISVDGVWCHAAFAGKTKLRFPLLADFEPKGAVARAYRVYRDGEGISERALFVIDGEGMIRWSYVSPIGINPGADGILDALEKVPGRPT